VVSRYRLAGWRNSLCCFKVSFGRVGRLFCPPFSTVHLFGGQKSVAHPTRLILTFSLFNSSCLQAAVVESTIVDFNDFVNSGSTSSYISNGYLFKITGTHYYPSQNIRVYSNQILTISRVDGDFFGLESFELTNNITRSQDWRVQNQDTSGFDFHREQTYHLQQYGSFESVSAIIFPGNRNHTYMILDNFVFSHVSNIPVPAALWLFGSAIFGWLGFSRCKTVAVHRMG